MKETKNRTRKKAIIFHGLELFAKNDAIAFIDECKFSNTKILGIDGFFLTEDTIQPSILNSIDLTAKPLKDNIDDIYIFAKNFIFTQDETMFFEIIYEE